VFAVTTGFFLMLALGGHINNLRLSEREPVFMPWLNCFAMLVCWLILGWVFRVELFPTRGTGMSGEKDVKKWYIPWFLIRLTLIAFLIEISLSLSL
jgi:hypothetical protein